MNRSFVHRAALHVTVLAEERYLAQAEPAGAVAALRRAGHQVRVVAPDRHVAQLTEPLDLGADVVLARGRSSALLTLLRAAETAGTPVVDRAAAVAGVVDKAATGAALAAAGVPVPPTWVGPVEALAARPDLPFPLVLKPVRGDNARGLVVVGSSDELAAVCWPEEVAIAQEFHRGEGLDLKLYVVGDRVWAVRRPSPVECDGSPRPGGSTGQPVRVGSTLAALALRCAAVTGLALAGIDCVDGPGGPLVIEVNDYPTFRGAHGAPEAVARLVERAALAVPRAA